jgi:SOS-response transcriptional repressor LexA
MNTSSFLKFDMNGGKIHGGYQLSGNGHYAEPRMEVNKKTRLRVTADLRPEIAEGLRAVRRSLGLTQIELAQLLGSSQGAITRWERAIDTPPVPVFLLLAELAPEDQRAFWIELSGGRSLERETVTGNVRSIPLLKHAAAAGTPRAVEEDEIERVIALPKDWLPRGGSLVAVKVKGDSMSPILETGYIVVVDITRRDPKALVGSMVIAREDNEVTIKWLRSDQDVYMLVPHHTTQRHPVRVYPKGKGLHIVGEVVNWTGWPYSTKK